MHGPKLVTGSDRSVEVHLEQTVQLDSRGTWLGRVGGARGVDYRLELVRERGEWRITNPPDALIIPRTHFESRYQQYFVYYFDPSGEVLIPQPTYLPHGEQAATLLVRRLLEGPDPRLEGEKHPVARMLGIGIAASVVGVVICLLIDWFPADASGALTVATGAAVGTSPVAASWRKRWLLRRTSRASAI